MTGKGLTAGQNARRLTAAQLSAITGPALAPGAAERLAAWGRGLDDSAVADKGPPQSIQVHPQMHAAAQASFAASLTGRCTCAASYSLLTHTALVPVKPQRQTPRTDVAQGTFPCKRLNNASR